MREKKGLWYYYMMGVDALFTLLLLLSFPIVILGYIWDKVKKLRRK